MGLDYELVYGQTPLDADESEGLRISTITSRKELDEFEQQNIQQAIQWTMSKKFTKEDILTELFIKQLHKKMYDDVWSWAGQFRNTNKNLGVDYFLIPVQLKTLLDDCHYWIDHETYVPDEIAVRFKHRLVSIHCFPNGNGRHSRLMADLIVDRIFTRPVFSWNGSREAYINAVRAADLNDLKPLFDFARN